MYANSNLWYVLVVFQSNSRRVSNDYQAREKNNSAILFLPARKNGEKECGHTFKVVILPQYRPVKGLLLHRICGAKSRCKMLFYFVED